MRSAPKCRSPATCRRSGTGSSLNLDRVSDVARQMRQAGLVPLAVALLGGVAVRDSHGRRVPVHHRVQVGDALGQLNSERSPGSTFRRLG